MQILVQPPSPVPSEDTEELIKENKRLVEVLSGCKDKLKVSVGEFVRSHPRGVYLITMNGHITCSIDGIIYDTFNPKDRLVWGAYRVI